MEIDKNMLVVAVLGVLVVVAILQSLQLNDLKGKVETASIAGATTTATAPATTTTTTTAASGSSTPTVPKSLENLPSMVGGC